MLELEHTIIILGLGGMVGLFICQTIKWTFEFIKEKLC